MCVCVYVCCCLHRLIGMLYWWMCGVVFCWMCEMGCVFAQKGILRLRVIVLCAQNSNTVELICFKWTGRAKEKRKKGIGCPSSSSSYLFSSALVVVFEFVVRAFPTNNWGVALTCRVARQWGRVCVVPAVGVEGFKNSPLIPWTQEKNSSLRTQQLLICRQTVIFGCSCRNSVEK